MQLTQRLQQAFPNNSTPPYVLNLLTERYQTHGEDESALRELGQRSKQASQQVQAASEHLRDLTRRREQQQVQAAALRTQLAGPNVLTLDGRAVGELLSAKAGYEHLLPALDAAVEQAREAERQTREAAANWEVLESLGRCRLLKTVPSDSLLQALDVQPNDGLFEADVWQRIEQQRAQQQRDAERRTRVQAQATAQREREDAERQTLLEELATSTDWQRLLRLAFGTTVPIGVTDVFQGGPFQEAGRLRLSEALTRSTHSDAVVRAALTRLAELAVNGQATTTAPAQSIYALAGGQW